MSEQHEDAVNTALEVRRLRRAVMVIAVALIATLTVLARPVIVPTLFAMLISLMLCPSVRRLQLRGVAAPLSAAVILAAMITAGAWGASAMSEPLSLWMQRTPQAIQMLRTEAARWGKYLTNAGPRTTPLEEVRVREADKPRLDAASVMSAAGQVAPRLRDFAIGIGATLALTYFMLLGGRPALRTSIAMIREPHKRRRALRWSETVQRQLTHYLLTVLGINLVLGAITAGLLAVVGVPGAIFLGTVVAVLNFMPFVGALISTAILAFTAFTTIDLPVPAIMVPAGFFVLHLLEAEFVTPIVLGRTLTLNPLFVILAVIVFGSMWGIGGAFLAVPLLIVAKVSFAVVPSTNGWSQVLGRRRLKLRTQQQDDRFMQAAAQRSPTPRLE
jgi:predicted PurR-regulated permease PerM